MTVIKKSDLIEKELYKIKTTNGDEFYGIIKEMYPDQIKFIVGGEQDNHLFRYSEIKDIKKIKKLSRLEVVSELNNVVSMKSKIIYKIIDALKEM